MSTTAARRFPILFVHHGRAGICQRAVVIPVRLEGLHVSLDDPDRFVEEVGDAVRP